MFLRNRNLAQPANSTAARLGKQRCKTSETGGPASISAAVPAEVDIAAQAKAVPAGFEEGILDVGRKNAQESDLKVALLGTPSCCCCLRTARYQAEAARAEHHQIC